MILFEDHKAEVAEAARRAATEQRSEKVTYARIEGARLTPH
jgi:hypothetical protein